MRAVEGVAAVLRLVGDFEAGPPLRVEHLRGQILQLPGVACAGAHGLEHAFRVHARLSAERDRFADAEVVQSDSDLVAELHYLAAAARTTIDYLLAEHVQHGPAGLEYGLVAAGHYGQRAVDGALLAAAHGRVEHFDSGLAKPRRNSARGLGRDSGHIDIGQTLARGFDDPAGAQRHLLDVR